MESRLLSATRAPSLSQRAINVALSLEPRLEPARWYVLALFFWLTASQCLVWFTFSSVPSTVIEYYCDLPPSACALAPGSAAVPKGCSCAAMSTGVVDQLLNWGPLTFVPTVPFVSWMLTFPGGLRRTMRLAAVLTFLATLLRLLPSVALTKAQRQHPSALLLLHAAQILNGIAGPVLIAGPSRLSALWFAPRQRATVTAAANASFFGAAIGFYAGPALTMGDPQNVPRMLYATLGTATVPLLCALLYCPDRPSSAPSAAVVSDDAKRDKSTVAFFRGAAATLRQTPSMFLLMAITGLSIGVYDTWIGVLPQILRSYPPQFAANPTLAGTAGAIHTFACILGMWTAGIAADKLFARRYKALLLAALTTAALCFAWVVLSVGDNIWLKGWTPLPSTTLSLFVAVALVGFLRTSTVPILYELGAEMTYPQPEGTSAGMIVIAEHATLLTALFIAPRVDVSYVSLATLVALAISPILALFISEEYKRSDAERGGV